MALNSPLTRRAVLKQGAGLTFAIGAAGMLSACRDGSSVNNAADAAAGTAYEPNIWATVYPDDRIKIMFASTEMGQGSMTHAPLMLAEEMDADWSHVEVETVAVDDRAYGNPIFNNFLYTAGSTAIEGYFDTLRIAGAQARWLLMEAVAQEWGVPMNELTTEPSLVVHSKSNRQMTYGEAAQIAQPSETLPDIDITALKPRSDYRYIGKSIPRIDVPSKVRGAAEYGIDVQVPNMVYATVVRAPTEGETALSIDSAEALTARGVTDIVTLPHAVAVVGDDYWGTVTGAWALSITWSETAKSRTFNSAENLEEYAKAAGDLSQDGVLWRDKGDINAAFTAAERTLQADYKSDYAYHAAMEPAAAVAHVNEDASAVELWAGTQTQSVLILGVAAVLGIAPEKVTLHPMLMGGSFGFRAPLHEQRWCEDAILISKSVGKPVKVIWTREDDVKTGLYRPLAAQTMRAAFDSDNAITGWNQRVASAAPLAFMNPIRWKHAKGKDIIGMNGSESPYYSIVNKRSEHLIMDRHARLCALRGVSASYTAFAAESFVDEVAYELDEDPLELRLKLCQEAPRAKAVLETLRDASDWGRKRKGRGLGLALAGYKKSIAAGAIEVSVEEASGIITPHKVWLVADIGLMISPRNVKAQLRGSIIYGLSLALKEQITIVNGETEQSNFYDYNVMRMNEVPEIELISLETDNPPTGVGELGVPMTAPALANAVFAATQTRLRHSPFLPNRVLAALKQP